MNKGIKYLLSACLICNMGSAVMAATPNFDLTSKKKRFKVYNIDDFKVDGGYGGTGEGRVLYTYNLGPTGLRGWIYSAMPGVVGHNDLSFWDDYTTVPPYQILVTSVGTNTPASDKFQINDVILGLKVGSAPPVSLFNSDTRVTLGNAITAAEAGNGQLCFRVNRYGVSTNIYVTIQLGLTNIAYSATAPYNCPKSALLLTNALNVINERGAVRSRLEALALMASGNRNYNSKVRAYMRGLAPADLTVTWPSWSGADGGVNPWDMGVTTMVLSEYYMKTGDSRVTNAVTQYATMIARSDTMWGTFGHGNAYVLPYHVAAGVHGYGSAYGTMTPPSLFCKLGLALAKKTGLPGIVNHPEVQPAIDRSVKFFGYYVDKGGLGYGEMEPGDMGHQWNCGRSGPAALFYGVLGNCPTQTQYFARYGIADYDSREWVHNGNGIGLCWVPLGVNMGGTHAAAIYAANTRWYFELNRRSDGSFTHECPGDSPVTATNYWDDTSYQGWLEPTAWNALFLSVPLRQLTITGKSANPENYISASAATNAIWSGQYSLLKTSYTEDQLTNHFNAYDPNVRGLAATELGTRCKTNETLKATWEPHLITMTSDSNAHMRATACKALGDSETTDAQAVNALVARLNDPQLWVRVKANEALNKLSSETLLPVLGVIATNFISHASPDPLVSINWADPCGWANGYLAKILFQKMPDDTIALGTNLMYQAVAVGLLGQPDGSLESTLNEFVKHKLTWTHVEALAPVLINCASKVSQANNMFDGAEAAVITCLGKYGVADGLAALSVLTDSGFTFDGERLNEAYQTYGTAATQLIPTLNNMKMTPLSSSANKFYAIVTSNATGPSVTNSFTRFTNVSASPSTVPLASSSVALSVSATNLSGGTLRYVWSKLSGPGVVTFIDSTNANCAASFSQAGTYVLRAGAVNSSIMNRSLFFNTTIPGGAYMDLMPMWTFNTWTNNYGITYTHVTVTVLPDGAASAWTGSTK